MTDAPKPPGARAEVLFGAIAEAADNAGMSVSVVHALPDGVELVYFNRATEQLLGCGADEIRKREVWAFIEPEEIPRVQELLTRRDRNDPPTPLETTLVRADGVRVPVEISTSPVVLEGVEANVTFVFDITHRRRAQEALRASEARFRSVIEGAPDGIVLLQWPTILYCNAQAARMWGFQDVSAPVGLDVTTLMAPDEGERATERVERLHREGSLHEPAQYRGRDPHGKELSIEISSIPIEYDGSPAVLAFARDVTERNALMAGLMEADKLAAVGTLAAGVAHEINNPLAYLMLNLDFIARELPRLADDKSLLPKLQERLREAHQGAERVKTIVRDLQAFTRKDEEIRGPVELDAVIDTAMQMARHELRQRARLVRNFEAVPPVHGNATRFEQLFLNLLINAAQSIEESNPGDNRIELSLRNGHGGKVIAEVRDTGSGMEEAVRVRAFDPFFTTKETGVGTGLGLAICQGIVHAVGGQIWLESELGKGTCVTIELDAHPFELPAEQRPAAAPHPRGGRVLVVDDERSVADSLALALGDRHQVVTALTATDARHVLSEAEPFDAVLCDLAMPEESGVALYDRMGREQPHMQERFIFITGGAFHPDALEFLQRTSRPCIQKPFEIDELQKVIAETIAIVRRRSQRPGA